MMVSFARSFHGWALFYADLHMNETSFVFRTKEVFLLPASAAYSIIDL